MEIVPLEFLKQLTFHLTTQCNLNCHMCGQVITKSPDGLEVENLKALLDVIPGLRSIHFFGGEPLLYRGIDELMAYARPRAKTRWMTTNGLLLHKYMDPVIKNLDGLTLSLDSTDEKVNDHIRGLEGSTRVIMNNLEELARRRRKGSPVVVINMVITKWNYSQLEESYQNLMERYPRAFDILQFHLPRFVSDSLGERHERTMATTFGCPTPSWRPWRGHGDGIDVATLAKSIKNLKNRERVAIFGVNHEVQLEGFFHEVDFPLNLPEAKTRTCGILDNSLTIRPNGDVVLCTDFPDYVFGNITKEPLVAIWNGEKMKPFRRYLAEHRFFPICAKCPRATESLHLSTGRGLTHSPAHVWHHIKKGSKLFSRLKGLARASLPTVLR